MCKERNHSRLVNRLGSNFYIPLLAIMLILVYGVSSSAYGAVVPKSTPFNSGDENSSVQQKILNLQIPFIANQGQVKDRKVRFYAQTMGGAVYITHDGQMAYFFLNKKSSQGLMVKERLVNATGVILKGSDPARAKVNYIIGNDSKEWKTGLDTFNTLSFGQVYQGIDLNLKAHGKTIEKIFTVKPGADPQIIQLSLLGSDERFVNESGELEVRYGKETISFSRPIAFQEIEGRKVNVAVAYHLKDSGYGFEVGKYDTAYPLTIDPSLVYVSYLGGDSDDAAYDVAVDDGSGHIYVAGSTYSSLFSYGDSNGTISARGADAFVVKLSREGVGLAFTYLGGSEDDFCYGMAFYDDKIYLTGQTQSKKFPSKNGYDTKIGGGVDAWFAVLDALRLSETTDVTSIMITGTYLGGGGADTGFAVAVDSYGNAYVAGETLSSSFPVPDPNVPFASSKGGVDAFVAKFGPSSIREYDLLYSTFIGGNGDDLALDIAVTDPDGEGNGERLYVTGQTASPNLPLTGNPFAPVLSGLTDAYLAVFQYANDEDRLKIDFLSYLGMTGQASGEAIAISGESVYIGGWTDVPGGTDGFVALINEDSSGSVTHTCTASLDNSSDDRIYDLAVDEGQNVIAVGETDSSDMGEATNIFVAEVSMGAAEPCVPVIPFYVDGGGDSDVANAISFDIDGNAYLAGTSYGFGELDIGNQDAFLAKLCEDSDGDGICNLDDNCEDVPNGKYQGTCSVPLRTEDANGLAQYEYIACDDDSDCLDPKYLGYCSKDNEDNDGDEWGDACDDDDDDDGMPDWWEVLYGLNPLFDDSQGDPDGDGLQNLHEYDNKLYNPNLPFTTSTNPLIADHDSDGWLDLMEVQAATDPTDEEKVPGSEIFELGIYVVDPEHGNDNNLGTDQYPLISLHAAIDRVNLLEPWPAPDYLGGSYKVVLEPGTYMPERLDNEPAIDAQNHLYWVEPDKPLVINQNVILTRSLGSSGDIIFSPDTFNDLGEPQKAENWKTALTFSPGLERVTLQQITINGFERGVVFNTVSGCATLNNVRIENCKEGITLIETTQLKLSLTGLGDYDFGIFGCESGIKIETISSNNTIVGGFFENNAIGIDVHGGVGNILEDGEIRGSGNEYGILLQPGAESFIVRDSTIDGLNVGLGFKTDGSHVALEKTFIQNCATGIEFLENYMTTVDLGTGDDVRSEITDSTDAGILFRAGSSNNTVLNGLVTNNLKDGIRFEACVETPDDNLISGTEVTNNGDAGIALLEGSGNRIEQAIVGYNQTGIRIADGSDGSVVQEGSVRDNATNFSLEGRNNLIGGYDEDGNSMAPDVNDGSGIGFLSGSGNQVIGVTLNGEDIDRKYGLLIGEGASDLLLDGVSISNFDVGIGFESDGACVKMSGVSISNCGIGMDIAEKYMLDIDLGDTQIYGCETGVRLIAGSSNNTVRHGNISGNYRDGIRVEGCSETPDGNTFINVTVGGNAGNGIAILDGFNNQVIDSIVSGNNTNSPSGGFGGIVLLNGSGSVTRTIVSDNGCHGIYVDEAADVKLVGNLVYGNKDGIRLGFSNEVLIENNTIADNACSGLWIEDGSEPYVKYSILHGNGITGGENLCKDTFSNDTRFDIFLGGTYSPNNLNENNIGNVNQIDIPPSNISVDPKFNKSDPATAAYALQSSSYCIDATTREDQGVDLLGLTRPKGRTWDMGAIESSAFKDEDDDGLPDTWEEDYFGSIDCSHCPPDDLDCNQCGADDDFDDDGVSNIEEFLKASDPSNPLYIEIVDPAANPAFAGGSSVNVAALVKYKTGLVIDTVVARFFDGDGILHIFDLTYDGNTGWYTGTVSGLEGGSNFIGAQATVESDAEPATDNISIIVDVEAPTVYIIHPTFHEEYVTALPKITLSGLASDDTAVTRVTWKNRANDDDENTATGTNNWTAGPIDLVPGVANTIVITAHDAFDLNGEGTDQINVTISQIALEAGLTSTDADQAEGFGAQQAPGTDPRDADGDLYTNDDEIACGSDPLIPCTEGTNCPDNYFSGDSIREKYPVGHDKEGYRWPNCQRDDIDDDEMPNWWEEEYAGLDPLNPVDAGGDLDLDTFSNLVEFENGTDPTIPQAETFGVTVTDLDEGKPYEQWLPKFDQTLQIRAEWTSPDPAPAQAVFSLKMTSNYPGRAVNDPDPAQLSTPNYPSWYYDQGNNVDNYHGPDFGLATSAGDNSFAQGPITVDEDGGYYTIYLRCWDFGGRTKVLVTDPVTGNNIGHLWIPQDTDRNGLGDAWESGIPQSLEPNADVDAIVFHKTGSYSAPLGDDFSNFEEYRGIVHTKPAGGALNYLRLDPLRKDLFIRADGFNAEYPFSIGTAYDVAGIDVHDTTDWGHDATDDGSFFVYYTTGSITSVNRDIGGTGTHRIIVGDNTEWSQSWPRHEWEFQLFEKGGYTGPWQSIGYWDSAGRLFLNYPYLDAEEDVVTSLPTNTYRVRKPVPHINVLIVKRDNTPGGHIQFMGASPPSQQNPTGARSWRWATKGYAWTNLPEDRYSMYGLAVALQSPLEYYFTDKPYENGQTWFGSAENPWETDLSEDERLDPLSMVEDQTDQMSPTDGIMGDTINNEWDGDKRLPFDRWNEEGLVTLSPFDIDNDGLIELPVQHDPALLTKGVLDSVEYDLQQVLEHTITHEIGHALGGPTHTSDPTCLMYKYSKNWSRADYLSDYFRSLLRVHNKIR